MYTKPAFTRDDFITWARSKNPNERYNYMDNNECPIAQFLYDTDRADSPHVTGYEWFDEARLSKKGKPEAIYGIPDFARDAARAYPFGTFGDLVRRYEEQSK